MKPTKHWYMKDDVWVYEVLENREAIPKIECPLLKKNLLYRTKNKAKRAGLPFNLSLEDVLIPSHCPALGIPLRMGQGKGPRTDSPCIDLIHPEKGYVRGNIVIVSFQAHQIRNKGNITLENLRRLINFYEEIM